MLRRDVLVSLSLAAVATLWPWRKTWACACGGTTTYVPFRSLQQVGEGVIEEAFDLEFGAGNWVYTENLDMEVNHPTILENAHVIPVSIILRTLPEGYDRCRQITLFRWDSAYSVSTPGGYDLKQRQIYYRIAKVEPADVMPVIYGTRYRGQTISGHLYVALSFESKRGNPYTLVYRFAPLIRGGGCNSTVFIDEKN